jgi:hypothetical protein
MWWHSEPAAAFQPLRYDHFIGGAISGVVVLSFVQLFLLLKCYFRSRPAKASPIHYGKLEVRRRPQAVMLKRVNPCARGSVIWYSFGHG